MTPLDTNNKDANEEEQWNWEYQSDLFHCNSTRIYTRRERKYLTCNYLIVVNELEATTHTN